MLLPVPYIPLTQKNKKSPGSERVVDGRSLAFSHTALSGPKQKDRYIGIVNLAIMCFHCRVPTVCCVLELATHPNPHPAFGWFVCVCDNYEPKPVDFSWVHLPGIPACHGSHHHPSHPSYTMIDPSISVRCVWNIQYFKMWMQYTFTSYKRDSRGGRSKPQTSEHYLFL